MYLVDTSVWIGYFRNQSNSAIKQLIKVLDEDIPYSITGIIYQEILQGSSSQNDFDELSQYFSTQHFLSYHDDRISYQSAARIYFDCRRKGITVRSVVDCLIAQIAIENDAILLHNDIDFVHIHKVCPKLRLH